MKRFKLGSEVINAFLLAVPSYAQVGEAWVARYNEPEYSGYVAYALAVNGSGNVYVTGYSGDNDVQLDVDTATLNS